MLEPRQGGDICSLAGLTWPHVIIPATMSSLQYRHGAPPRHGAMCRGPPSGGFYPVGGFLSEPCQYIPCPLLPTTWSHVFFARHNINTLNLKNRASLADKATVSVSPKILLSDLLNEMFSAEYCLSEFSQLVRFLKEQVRI